MPNSNRPAVAGAAQTRAERNDTRSLVMNGEILLYGIVDPFSMFCEYGDSIRAVDVMSSLAELGAQERITVRINSPGGVVMEGLAIYNALRAWGKPIDIIVDAMAASIASIIAMAGDTITMAENATMMVHDPHGGAYGNAEDLRSTADEIDRQRDILVNIYVSRSGRTVDEVMALMTAETHMSATQAVELGFATAIVEPMRIAACTLKPNELARVIRAPETIRAHRSDFAAPAATPEGGHDMPQENRSGNNAAADTTTTTTTNLDATAIRAEAMQQERARAHGITTAVRAARLDQAFADELIREGVTVDQANARVINRFSELQTAAEGNGSEVNVNGHIRITADQVDRWQEGVGQALALRAGLLRGEEATRAQASDFAGMTLVEIARSSLSVRNMRPSGNRMEMVGQAFTVRNAGPGYHSSSDFGTALGNIAQRSMMRGYTELDETFEVWTGRGILSDFRPASRVDVGLFPGLDKVEEGSEYKYGTFGDTGTSVILATYGKLFAITRQAIINDDMGVFTRVPDRMGRAAKRTIGNLVYAILNGNPTMQDGTALFHANHGNLASVAAAPSVASLGAARVAMMRQADLGGITTGVGIRPAYAILPPELEDAFNVVTKAIYDPTIAAASQATTPMRPNPVANFAQPVVDGRLSGTSWFLAANPGQVDTIEVDYLDGNDQPFLDEREGWTVDGTEMKVRIDAGVKALHWRGLFKNAGA
jgi:ATP-dependent Clp endopeptidase proteolytic subunit ClpP